jgi:hypothetical protein
MDRLFGHLAVKFGRSAEDLATEGLRYLLDRRVAREAFVGFVNARAAAELPEALAFRTQEGTEDGDGRPDMLGVAGDGATPLVVESKFWAGLTAHQPNGYLRELAGTPGSVLLFLVPHPRREYIWPTLRARAEEEFVVAEGAGTDGAAEGAERPSFVLDLANGTTLVLASWRDALNAIEAAVRAEGGMHALLEDIHQVQSLCERYSDEGFIPLRGDELGQDVGKRLRQVHLIVQDLRSRMGAAWDGAANMSTSRKRYTFKTTLYGFPAVIGVKYIWWARRGQSPIWLRVKARDGDRCTAVVRALQPAFGAFDDAPSYPTDVLLPLPLKPGVERDAVLDDLAAQLDDIAERLRLVLAGPA